MDKYTEDLKSALNLALARLIHSEHDGSRAVSDEFVAIACVLTGHYDEQCMMIIDTALSRVVD